ncbi:hypothetical protein JKP88DRAFT_253642 [Tribonema minus]|uniref:Uncharacterized protein n=1 Tax=Tribonema minus TaxID=303371 RepID=A0A835Z5T5_9STRA|nr:hypothetical protein JKP88DRAFT_253642 [Tribonema minus]
MTVSSGAAERRAMRAEALAMSLQGKLATAQTELGVVRAQLKELQGEAAAMVAVEHRCSALKVSSRRRSSAARPLSTSTCHDTQAADDVSSNASALHADTSLHSDRLSLSKKLDFAMRTSRAESLGATQSVASERRHAAVLKGTSRRDTATALSSLRSGMTVAGDLLLDSPGSRARAPAEKHRGTARLSSLAGCAHDGAVDATAHSEEKCSPADSAASEVGDGGCGTCQTTGDSRTSSSGAHKVTSAQRQVPIVRRCVTMCGMLMAVACVLLAIVAIPLMAIDGPAHRPRVSLLPIDVPFAQAPPLTKATTSAQPVHKERCWLWCRLWRLFQ